MASFVKRYAEESKESRVQALAIYQLLRQKGIFTEEEYQAAADAALQLIEDEEKRKEQELKEYLRIKD
jgi:hypothetical protein